MEKPPKVIFASVPDPTADVAGLYKTVAAMKIAIEQMIGTRDAPTGERKVSVFVTDVGITPSGGVDGDLWLFKGGEITSLSVMVNGQWMVIWP
jgi:hypothetical protein